MLHSTLLPALFAAFVVTVAEDPLDAAETFDSFDSYWYRGLAELDRYELSQSRYGEIHDGEAVLVFVTEDLLVDELVKHERGPRPRGAVQVLKLNAWRTFDTGVYPYTLMTTVFQPVRPAGATALKRASSLIEWCGVSHQKLELRDGAYRGRLDSYFQGESRADVDLEFAWVEEALFTTARRDPESLPTGTLRVIPAAHHQRMAHLPLEVHDATGALEQGVSADQDPPWIYSLQYTSLDRLLEFGVEQAFPHRILWWREGPIDDPSGLATTEARLTHSVLMDFWNHHGVGDADLDRLLGRED